MSERSDAWGTAWMIVAMVLLAALIVVCVLLSAEPGGAWDAAGALGGWAAAAGTFAAVLAALRLAKRDEDRRRDEERQEEQRIKLQISVAVNNFSSICSELRELRNRLDNRGSFNLNEIIRLAEGVSDKVAGMPYLDWHEADSVLAVDVSSLLSHLGACLHALRSAEKESDSVRETRLSDAGKNLEIAILLSNRITGAHPARRALKRGSCA